MLTASDIFIKYGDRVLLDHVNLVIGEKEANSENLSIRDRQTGNVIELSFDDFVNEINKQTKGKPFTGLNLPKHLSKRPQLMV